MTKEYTKAQLTDMLYAFIGQRSGIEYANYGDRAGFMADYRRILRDGRDARAMLRAVELSSMPADVIVHHLTGSGRLQLTDQGLEYITGQYFPTEYRAATCSALSNILIQWYGMDKGVEKPVERAWHWAKRNLGRGIAKRWFI